MQSLASTSSLSGAALLTRPRSQMQAQNKSVLVTRALFTKKRPAPVVEEKPVKKAGFTLFGGKKTTTTKDTVTTTKKTTKKIDKAAEYKRQESVLSAFDFSTARSKSDAELLYEARYGNLGKDGKMSREQYQALRRKIGGTAKDYWKTWIDVDGKYVDKGYVAKDAASTASNVPALPFLIGIVVALFGTLGYVVAQTSQ